MPAGGCSPIDVQTTCKSCKTARLYLRKFIWVKKKNASFSDGAFFRIVVHVRSMEYIKMKGILYEQNLIRLVTSAPSPSYMFRADFLLSSGEGLAARKFQRFESKSLQPFPSADIKILYIISVWGRWLAKQDGRGNEKCTLKKP